MEGEARRPDVRSPLGNYRQAGSCLTTPKTNRAIGSTAFRRQDCSIEQKRYALGGAGMSFKRAQQTATVDIPQLDCSIITSAGQYWAPRTKRNAPNPAVVHFQASG